MPDEMLTLSQVGAVNVIDVRLPEAMDSTDFDQLNDSLPALFAKAPAGRWVVNLNNARYLGSAALGLLVNMRQQVKSHGGKLALCHLSDDLLKIFKTCCLERLFTICKTQTDAVRAVE